MNMNNLENNKTSIDSNQFTGKFLSLSSWVTIDSHNEVNATLSLSLRARLLYGKHLFEDLIKNGDFGDQQQITNVLELCVKEGVLIVHKDQCSTPSSSEIKVSKQNSTKHKLYKRLLSWLN